MIKNYRQYVNESAGVELTQEQKHWLNVCTNGDWDFNPQTGEVNVANNFVCSNQDLTDFKGVRFGEVGGNFYCSHNQLITLEGAPKKVEGHFSCPDNKLTSLSGAPEEVTKNFYCHNNNLTSLEGAPRKIDGDFYCGGNKINTLKGMTIEVKGSIDMNPNPILNEIRPYIDTMSKDEKKFFFQVLSGIDQPDRESIERIARSIERMRMI